MTEQTTTLYIPFRPTIFLPETSSETMIVLVPPGMESKPELSLLLRDLSVKAADDLGFVIRAAEWWVTSDPAVVERRGEGDRCPICFEGKENALAHLEAHPDAVLAVGRLSWCTE